MTPVTLLTAALFAWPSTPSEQSCLAAVLLHTPVSSWIEQAVVAQTTMNAAKFNDPPQDICEAIGRLDTFGAFETVHYPVTNDREYAEYLRQWHHARDVVEAVITGDYMIGPASCAKGSRFSIAPTQPAWTGTVVCVVGNVTVYR